jgi:hypothetical protein
MLVRVWRLGIGWIGGAVVRAVTYFVKSVLDNQRPNKTNAKKVEDDKQ